MQGRDSPILTAVGGATRCLSAVQAGLEVWDGQGLQWMFVFRDVCVEDGSTFPEQKPLKSKKIRSFWQRQDNSSQFRSGEYTWYAT